MPSKEAFRALLKQGYPVDQRVFERYDTLEHASDVCALADVLRKHKQPNGTCPIFTLNVILHNPDFEAIRRDAFAAHHTEFFTSTYQRLNKGNVPNVFSEGMQEGIFKPQLHGYVHYQTSRWMQQLQDPTSDARAAFDLEMVGVPSKDRPADGNRLMIALAADSEADEHLQVSDLSKAVEEFTRFFGFAPVSFIAPVYTWYDRVEEVLSTKGVVYLQGGRSQHIEHFAQRNLSKQHYTGESNTYAQRYMVRTVFFEPVYNPSSTLIDHCMHRMRILMAAGIPVVISTHRINYVGGLDEAHRDRNLVLLDEFIRRITAEWPDVSFLSSDQLGQLIQHLR